MTEDDRFDVLFIGAGQSGIPLAHDLAKAGKRGALVEKKQVKGHEDEDPLVADHR